MMTTLREAAQQALEALEKCTKHLPVHFDSHFEAITSLRAALAEPVQEPVAWMLNLIDDNIITHRPADIDRHPDRWTALYPEPKPCPTCEALARTVMMDQTGYDTAPPQRKPLTDEEIAQVMYRADAIFTGPVQFRFARAIERAHGIIATEVNGDKDGSQG